MKAKNVLDKLKDLKLRRWGPAEYTEAKNGGEEGSTEIDYEAIYQFYKNKVIESIPEQYMDQVILPEHYVDIECGYGYSEEYENKNGIWFSNTRNYNLQETDSELFCEITTTPYLRIDKRIYFGTYKFIQK